ncbi:MAG TPA: substrate-binding domain-containing protein [Solirubrobacterales bacterium]|nr:substrate-binding domain-containing protein [Solirubrobacterales bacterium]
MVQPKLTSSKHLAAIASAAILALGIASCGNGDDSSTGGGGGGGSSKSIRIDGSSAVAPLTEVMAERFMAANPDVRISVGSSDTSRGFERLCAGEADIVNASRAMDREEEEACEEGGVGPQGFRVATDALTLIVNYDLYVFCLSVDQLAAIWGPDSEIERWNEVPGVDKESLGLEEEIDEELALFGPGPGSGPFDRFTEAINGEEGAIRKSYEDVGEDDEATVKGVETSPGGFGYVSFSSYVRNANRVRVVDVDYGEGCVLPTVETAQDGRYAPLTNPLFIYPSEKALREPEVRAFVEYYLRNVNSIAESAGFVPLTKKQLAKTRKAAEEAGLR